MGFWQKAFDLDSLLTAIFTHTIHDKLIPAEVRCQFISGKVIGIFSLFSNCNSKDTSASYLLAYLLFLY